MKAAGNLPKLIDEYYWVTITMGCPSPNEEELERWAHWARKETG